MTMEQEINELRERVLEAVEEGVPHLARANARRLYQPVRKLKAVRDEFAEVISDIPNAHR